MKKAGTTAMLVVSAMCIGFIAGILFGRHFAVAPVTVQPIKTEYVAPSIDSGSEAPNIPGNKININTASSVVLDTLPGIGPVLAERIITYRNENGPFASVEELSKVEGIGSKTLLEILNLITVED